MISFFFSVDSNKDIIIYILTIIASLKLSKKISSSLIIDEIRKNKQFINKKSSN